MDIFSPLDIGSVSFPNRTVMAPAVINSAGPDGLVTTPFKDFYMARGRGGVGFVMLGAAFVHPDGRGFGGQLAVDGDHVVPGLTGLVEDLAGTGARVGVQLSFKGLGRQPENYTLEEIRQYRSAFTRAAKRAKQCGFHAVELHACHEYWLSFFLSPHFNHRTDEYGGGLDGRFRLLRETVQEVRNAVDTEMLVGVRLGLDDFIGGLGLHEALEIGCRLEALGVDYLSASAGIGVTQYRMSPPSDIPRGPSLMLARSLQQIVSVPVICVGRMDRPGPFREAVEGGHASMVAAARALIADPDFVRKIHEGREVEIRPCIACNHCLHCLHRGEAVRCTVNPFVGRDLLEIEPIEGSARILVVGGGPAGLTAASLAAKRGADVEIWEREDRLGGALNVAAVPPHKEVLGDLSDFLASDARRAGVRIHLGREAGPDIWDMGRFTHILIATGARPVDPPFETPDPQCVVTAEELLGTGVVAPGRYLVVGGGMVGLETADHLSARPGVEVTVVEMCPQFGAGVAPIRLKLVLDRLIKAGANLLARTRVLAVNGSWVDLELPPGRITLGPFKGVVLAAGYRSDTRLTRSSGDDRRLIVIGDARSPGTINEAVTEACNSALELTM
jgi:2,4-dienoyl-CoA reductase-like NADH-dependent reductase (Old Yellow Enzyme family)/thioredoxin reductase